MAGAGRQHLVETGMSYDAHRQRAWRIGGALMVAGGACIVHGLLPGLFADKASRTIIRLHEEVSSTPSNSREPFLLEFEI